MDIKVFGQTHTFTPTMGALRRIEAVLDKYGVKGGLLGFIPKKGKKPEDNTLSMTAWVDFVCAALNIEADENADIDFVEVDSAAGEILAAYYKIKNLEVKK